MRRSLLAELRRRNVIRAAILYVGSVWALAQGISQLGPSVGAPEWTTRWFLAAAAIGFPFWLAFAWFYEWTPQGFRREREIEPGHALPRHASRKLDLAISGVLAIAVVLLLTDRFVLRQGVNEQTDVPVSDRSIAVLPFADISQAKDQEYFSDGIAEELLNLLSKVTQLHVAARTSSFSFKGKEVPIPEIARVLHVANVLEGSVRKSGEQVRITAQLIRAADGYQIWSETYDRRLDDVFKIQDEISAKVVEQLKVTLLGGLPKARATDPKAYALFLQARQLSYRFTIEAMKQSDDLCRQALAIDPDYVPAWIQLADNAMHEAQLAMLSNEDALRQARAAAERALTIDPDSALASAQLGWIESTHGELAAAARHFTRALALEPSNNIVLRDSYVLLHDLGRANEAIDVLEFLAVRDPVDVTVLYNLGLAYTSAGRFDDAIRQLRIVTRLSPDYGLAHIQTAYALLLEGDAAAALHEAEQESSENFRLTGLAMADHALGRNAGFEAAMAELIGKYEKDMSSNIAYVFAFCGDADKAFAWLDKAVTYEDTGLAEILLERLFDNVRKDPRWLPFLRRIDKAPEQVAKIEFKVTLPAGQAEAMPSAPVAAAKR